MDYEEIFKRRLRKAGVTLMYWFVGSCINLAFLFVLEWFTANIYVYFVAGTVCGHAVYGVIKTLRKKASEREAWEELCKQGGRFTPAYLKKGREGK